VISLSFDGAAIARGLDGITAAAQEAVRPAAQAGAQVFYDEVRQRVPVSSKPHSTKGKKQTYQPGNLRAAIYQAFMEEVERPGHASYRISWNHKKAYYGRFIEFGTPRMAARPFVRPAFDAMQALALEASREVMFDRLKEAIA